MMGKMGKSGVPSTRGGIDATIYVGCQGSTAAGSNKIAKFALNATNNPFKKLKVISYTNLSGNTSDTPRIDINGVQNQRPAVGTEYDIEGKAFTVWVNNISAAFTESGITVQLST